ncbi:MAG: GFA family protein [Deltaproteobacteria bacterium]|nr:GFA family protein [Deltaproteobacteria bacterium]MBW2414633.1 GFA family protein [Deltaproteobacteria bacterium]
MSSPTPASGTCLCGAVAFSVRLPTLFCVHCHCSMCRRSHGAAFVTWIGVPRSQFDIVQGEDALLRYDSSEHGWRSFCGRCGSSLFCENQSHPDQVDIVLANIRGSFAPAPQAHIFWDDRASWTVVADDLPRLGGKSGTEPVEEGG